MVMKVNKEMSNAEFLLQTNERTKDVVGGTPTYYEELSVSLEELKAVLSSTSLGKLIKTTVEVLNQFLKNLDKTNDL